MRYFNVRINITRESYFNYDVEADSHEEAEAIVKSLVWDDVLDDELRQHAEIVDERYDALQQFVCGECGASVPRTCRNRYFFNGRQLPAGCRKLLPLVSIKLKLREQDNFLYIYV